MAKINCTTNRLPIPKSNVRIFSSFFELTNLALAKMARDYLAMQGSCVQSQRSFSLSGPTVTNLRNHPETVRSANSWLKQKILNFFFILK